MAAFLAGEAALAVFQVSLFLPRCPGAAPRGVEFPSRNRTCWPVGRYGSRLRTARYDEARKKRITAFAPFPMEVYIGRVRTRSDLSRRRSRGFHLVPRERPRPIVLNAEENYTPAHANLIGVGDRAHRFTRFPNSRVLDTHRAPPYGYGTER